MILTVTCIKLQVSARQDVYNTFASYISSEEIADKLRCYMAKMPVNMDVKK